MQTQGELVCRCLTDCSLDAIMTLDITSNKWRRTAVDPSTWRQKYWTF